MNRTVQIFAVVAVGLFLTAFYFLTANTATITISDDGQIRSLRTSAATVGGALQQAGIEVDPEDLVEPALSAPLSDVAAITITRSLPVELRADGVTLRGRTHARTLAEIAAGLGVALGPQDRVLADGRTFAPGDLNAPLAQVPAQIEVRRAVPFAVLDDGQMAWYASAADTVGEALADARLGLDPADAVEPSPESPLVADMRLVVRRARPVTVQVDGATIAARTLAQTVGAALAEIGVALIGLDFSLPDLAEPLPADGLVRVVRVREDTLTEQKPIPFETTYQAIPTLDIDNYTLVQPGANGTLTRRVRVRYEDGVEVERLTEGEWVSQAPTPKIIGYGTNIVVRTLDTPNGPIEYWRALTMYATSYSPSRAGTPQSAPWYGRTRSGKALTKGMVAIDLNVMPLGTPLYIPGYGFATAEDTGNGVKGKWIDLGYEDSNYVSWHSNVTVYFLTPVPSADRIKWVLP